MQTRFYFPVSVELGLAVLRKQMRLEQAFGEHARNVVGFTDREVAIRHERDRGDGDTSNEVCLVVAAISNDAYSRIISGDFTHHGPLAHFRATDILELEITAMGYISHDGHLSLEIVK